MQGLRIDHVDGLLDPKEYLKRLRAKVGQSLYLVVEKILSAHENLREDWPVEGTTGYEFCGQLTGLLVDAAAEDAFTRFYREFTGRASVPRNCAGMQNQNHGKRDAERVGGALARCRARSQARSANHGFYAEHFVPGAEGDDRVFSCLPHLCRRSRPAAKRMNGTFTGPCAQASKKEKKWTQACLSFWKAAEREIGGATSSARFYKQAAIRCAMKAQQFERAGDGQGAGGHGSLPVQPFCGAE